MGGIQVPFGLCHFLSGGLVEASPLAFFNTGGVSLLWCVLDVPQEISPNGDSF